jgi:hypothetical protein
MRVAFDDNIYNPDDWEGGLSCMDCGWIFVEGQTYSQRLSAFTRDGIPILEIICSFCALDAAFSHK